MQLHPISWSWISRESRATHPAAAEARVHPVKAGLVCKTLHPSPPLGHRGSCRSPSDVEGSLTKLDKELEQLLDASDSMNLDHSGHPSCSTSKGNEQNQAPRLLASRRRLPLPGFGLSSAVWEEHEAAQHRTLHERLLQTILLVGEQPE